MVPCSKGDIISCRLSPFNFPILKPTIMIHSKSFLILILSLVLLLPSCVSKKKFQTSQVELKRKLKDSEYELGKAGKEINKYMERLNDCEKEKAQEIERLNGTVKTLESNLSLREEQINDLKDQIQDIRKQRDVTVTHIDDLTELNQSANANIKETLTQLENKDKYIHLLQAAKSRTDSINLALAVNLKSVLKQGIEDSDVEVKVDKTVVFVNLSDKMLYTSGSYTITNRAHEVLGKIAKIVQSRPDLEVMIEGYTDNVAISNSCTKDNWDLSVLRATSVARALQTNHGVDPNRLIAAGRGEYNTLASNSTPEGRQMNRRTRIIILPKLDQFYDLLDPKKVPK